MPEGSERHPVDPKLVETVYKELRAIAQHRLRDERAGHTLQATALVHEVWLKLQGQGASPFGDRAEFVGTAAEAMRRILVDHARTRARKKRGGADRPDGAPRRRIPLDVLDLAQHEDPLEVLALEDALARLEEADPEAYQVVRLRFFVGLTGAEAAEVLGISRRSADRAWAFARAALQRDLYPRSSGGGQ